MTDSVDLQPDNGDVLQEEAPDTTTVPVCVVETKSPIRVQQLPRKGGATFQRTVSTAPLRVLTADHRRASATLISTATANVFLVAFSSAAAQDPLMMIPWPGAVPFVTDATTEVWVRVPDSAESFALGVATQMWAEGE